MHFPSPCKCSAARSKMCRTDVEDHTSMATNLSFDPELIELAPKVERRAHQASCRHEGAIRPFGTKRPFCSLLSHPIPATQMSDSGHFLLGSSAKKLHSHLGSDREVPDGRIKSLKTGAVLGRRSRSAGRLLAGPPATAIARRLLRGPSTPPVRDLRDRPSVLTSSAYRGPPPDGREVRPPSSSEWCLRPPCL